VALQQRNERYTYISMEVVNRSFQQVKCYTEKKNYRQIITKIVASNLTGLNPLKDSRLYDRSSYALKESGNHKNWIPT
jgi:hypothetical protein